MIEGVREMVISDSGTLIYRPGTDPAASTSNRTLIWVDRKGNQEPLKAPPNHFRVPKISPDGTKVASAVVVGGNADIYIWDDVIENMTRLTFDKATENSPLWTPDGKRIVFASNREENGIYWKNADGTGEVELLYSSPDAFFLLPWSWSGDGKVLVIMEFPTAATADIGILSMENDHAYKRILQEEFAEGHPDISPDGRYIAYMSGESGTQAEIYVRPFPDVNKGKWQVSTIPGYSPLWSPDGRELYYLTYNGDAVMSVPVNTESTFSYEKPKELFRGDFISGFDENPPYDVHPDGKRFLMMIPDRSTDRDSAQETAAHQKIIIVQNWFEELKQRVPAE